MRVFRATCASLAAVAITAFSFATTPAFAGPDDDRSVETKAHVDAPKVLEQRGEHIRHQLTVERENSSAGQDSKLGGSWLQL